ncbi:hypothetical protein KPC83_04820 [Collinsella sp. zg1085]|uniref:hypothetical protein n=1 Tax=Collinsella sp. zg1085 TaxID=2844380 RepID=UPI001C0DF913|nr:hypothetical protein [Collinsella sp. zg1085]QWT17169.1 hypothetical protein KPC83_04820 [Collinsella sp. zg1085]
MSLASRTHTQVAAQRWWIMYRISGALLLLSFVSQLLGWKYGELARDLCFLLLCLLGIVLGFYGYTAKGTPMSQSVRRWQLILSVIGSVLFVVLLVMQLMCS